MNYWLFVQINGAAGRWDGLDDTMEAAATWLIFGIFAVAAIPVALSLLRRRIRPVLELGAVLVLAFAGGQIVSHLSDQQRPFQSHHVHQLILHAPGVSLPSDHAMAAFAIAFGVFAFLSRRWGTALLIAAAVVGFARVWVGVHYPGDILAAAVIAALATVEVAVAGRVLPRRAETVAAG